MASTATVLSTKRLLDFRIFLKRRGLPRPYSADVILRTGYRFEERVLARDLAVRIGSKTVALLAAAMAVFLFRKAGESHH